MKKYIFLIIMVILSACSDRGKETHGALIGVVLPLTGKYASYGQGTKQGIELAAEDIRNGGGQIQLYYEDSKSTPKDGVSAGLKLINLHHVDAVIGDIASEITLALAPILEEKHVILFSPGSSSPSLTNAGDYIFRNWISDAYEGRYLAEFIKSKLPEMKKVSVIYANNDYGIGLKKEFANTFGSILSEDAFNTDTKSFLPILTKIKQKNPDGVFMIGYHQDYATILKQAKEINFSVQFFSSVSFQDEKVLQLAGDAANGVIYSIPESSTNDGEKMAFTERFEKRFGNAPSVFALHAYDATRILSAGMQDTKNVENLKAYLYGIKDYDGLSGKTTIDSNGDVIKPVTIKTVRNGRFVAYEK